MKSQDPKEREAFQEARSKILNEYIDEKRKLKTNRRMYNHKVMEEINRILEEKEEPLFAYKTDQYGNIVQTNKNQ